MYHFLRYYCFSSFCRRLINKGVKASLRWLQLLYSRPCCSFLPALSSCSVKLWLRAVFTVKIERLSSRGNSSHCEKCHRESARINKSFPIFRFSLQYLSLLRAARPPLPLHHLFCVLSSRETCQQTSSVLLAKDAAYRVRPQGGNGGSVRVIKGSFHSHTAVSSYSALPADRPCQER